MISTPMTSTPMTSETLWHKKQDALIIFLSQLDFAKIILIMISESKDGLTFFK